MGKMIRYGLLLAFGVAAIALTIHLASRHRARLGDTYTLKGCFYAAVPLTRDVATAAEIQELDTRFRWVRVDRLVQTDRASTVDYEDKVQVMELAVFSDVGFARVVVLEGENAGKSGWVPEAFLRK